MAAKVPNLRYYRESFGLSRKQLAKAITDVSINENQLYSYEREDSGNAPPIETLLALADFFGVSVDDLLRKKADFTAPASPVSLQLEKFGKRIKERRESLGLSRKEVARAAGITPAYLSIVEKGRKIPIVSTVLNILNALNMSADTAFMDSLIAAQDVKACCLQHQLAKLPPEKRFIALRNLELLVEALQ